MINVYLVSFNDESALQQPNLHPYQMDIDPPASFNREYFREIEIRPVLIEDDDANEVPEEQANQFGVYIRYDHEKALANDIDLNPSEWVAGSATKIGAERIAVLLRTIIDPPHLKRVVPT